MWLPTGGVASMSNVARRKPDGFDTAARPAENVGPAASQPIARPKKIRGNMSASLILATHLNNLKEELIS